MNPRLVKQLGDLNREFYARFAREFSETRSAGRLNLEPILPYVEPGSKLLDLGCGNGRLAERLDSLEIPLEYAGLDVTADLVAHARARTTRLRHLRCELHVADLTAPGWAEPLEPRAPFDLAIALAVLHHIPGTERRAVLLGEIHARLRAGGTLVMSNWQFQNNPRLARRVIPWSAENIDASELEPGDTLLTWERGGTGLRYVHLFDESEIETLARSTGFTIRNQFLGDSNQNLWSILSRP